MPPTYHTVTNVGLFTWVFVKSFMCITYYIRRKYTGPFQGAQRLWKIAVASRLPEKTHLFCKRTQRGPSYTLIWTVYSTFIGYLFPDSYTWTELLKLLHKLGYFWSIQGSLCLKRCFPVWLGWCGELWGSEFIPSSSYYQQGKSYWSLIFLIEK